MVVVRNRMAARLEMTEVLGAYLTSERRARSQSERFGRVVRTTPPAIKAINVGSRWRSLRCFHFFWCILSGFRITPRYHPLLSVESYYTYPNTDLIGIP